MTKQTTQPHSSQWESVLLDNRALAHYITQHSPEDVSEEFVELHFFGQGAILRWMPLTEIQPGPAASNLPSKAKQQRYARLPLDTMPPLVVQDGKIEDGHHRYRDALTKGAQGLWCYVVVDEEEAKHHLDNLSAASQKTAPSLSL